eukprot:scaffold4976_cov131-Isochrysis_galbana.AAC.5
MESQSQSRGRSKRQRIVMTSAILPRKIRDQQYFGRASAGANVDWRGVTMAFRSEQDLDMNEEAALIRLENDDANDPAPAFMPAPTGRLRLMQASLLGAAAMPSTARRERIAAAVPPCIHILPEDLADLDRPHDEYFAQLRKEEGSTYVLGIECANVQGNGEEEEGKGEGPPCR